MTTILKCAVIQATPAIGVVKENLDKVLPSLHEIAKAGGQLVLLPELFSTGYLLHIDSWQYAEPVTGYTVNWMKTQSNKLGIYLGMTFLEKREGDYYNSFVLTDPDGKISGVIRKRDPFAFESRFFLRGDDDHVIKTKIGTIGVGICFENQKTSLYQDFVKSKVNIILQPHCYVIPKKPQSIYSKKIIDWFINDIATIAKRYAKIFNVPVLMANQTGDWKSKYPLALIPFPQNAIFAGRSSIVDSDGNVLDSLEKEEGYVISNVKIPKNPKTSPFTPFSKNMLFKCPISRIYCDYLSRSGKKLYFKNIRKSKAKI